MEKTRLNLFDNSRVSDHRKCNRYFYFRHRRHLSSGDAIAADWGTCWSAAMDVVWPAVNKGEGPNKAVEMGYEAFCKEWTQRFNYPYSEQMGEEEQYKFGFRNEQTALEMLPNYIDLRRNLIESIEILSIEQPFAVPLFPDDPNTFYVGKIDKVILWEGYVWGLDHKTTGWYRKNGGFAPDWIDQWSLKSQPPGYTHALKMQFGDKAKGILIDGALTHKTVHDKFILIPLEKAHAHLEAWYWELQHELAIIGSNDKNLGCVDPDDPAMYAFPKNDNSCIMYMKACPYSDICKSVANPVSLTDEQLTQHGFQIKKWEPFDELKLQSLFSSEGKIGEVES